MKTCSPFKFQNSSPRQGFSFNVIAGLILAAWCLATVQPAKAAITYTWNQATVASNNWNVPGNWSYSGGTGTVPGSAASDIVIFTNVGVATATNTLNNVVTSNTTIAALSYGVSTTSGSFIDTLIPAGVTLTVSGNVIIGDSGATATTPVLMSGGGDFVTSGTGATMSVGGAGTPGTSQTAYLVLPNGTNYLTNGTLNIGNPNSGVNGANAYLFLGSGSNYLFASTINLGGEKSSGYLEFAGPTGSVNIANTAGTGRAAITLAYPRSGTGTCQGSMLFAGGAGPGCYANVLASTLLLGEMGGDTQSAKTDAATITLDNGTIDATSIIIGETSTDEPDGSHLTGSITIGGNATSAARLIVNSPSGPGGGSFVIADATFATAGHTTAAGTLTINTNGAAQISCNITKAGTANNTGTITINGGTLTLTGGTNVIGTPAIPIDNMNLTAATLVFGVAGATTIPINVTSLTIDGSTTDTNYFDITSLPAGTIAPTAITLVSASSFTSSSGNFNCAVSTLPAGYYGYLTQSGNSLVLELTNKPSTNAVSYWSGSDIPVNHNTNWTDAANWGDVAVPGTGASVIFNSSNATAYANASALTTPGGGPGALVAGKLNNVVNGSFTLGLLTYTNLGGTFENTYINNGDVVTVNSGSVSVGSGLADLGNTTVNATMSGPGGSLDAVTLFAGFYVGLGTAVANGSTPPPQASLDMSALGNLVCSNANFLVGVGGYTIGAYTNPQPSGVVYLAQTNIIYAASSALDNSDTVPLALEVGDADTMAGAPSSLYLGWSNAIYADTIATARQLASGGIFFNPTVISANPTVYIRGYSAPAVATWTIGDGVINGTTAMASSGTNDFTGGSVNALAGVIYVGKNSTGATASGQTAGMLAFNKGIINANTLNVSYNGPDANGNVDDISAGTVNVGGTGLLVANTSVNLAYVGGSQNYGGAPAATLNVTGSGSVWANAITAGTNNAISVISVSGGTLFVSNTAGTAAAPLTSLNVTNATLGLALAYAAVATPAIDATTINAGGATNVIDILSLPALASSSYPATLLLIQSGSLNGYNFGLGSLPAATPAYQGYVSQNGNAVMLTLTTGPSSSRPYVIWDGDDSAISTNWTDGQNWLEPGYPGLGDTVVFNDSAAVGSSPFSAIGGGINGVSNPNSINNAVDQNFTVLSLTYTNIGMFQNTWIDNGRVLTTSNLAVGSTSIDFGGTATEYVTIAGTNGAFTVSNTAAAVWIGLESASGESAGGATLDMSGLGTFSATVSTFAVGALASTATYPAGTVYLAGTNTITATGGTAAETGQDETLSLLVGETGKGGTSESYLYLGQSNTFNVNTLGVGISKLTGAMLFNPNLTGTPSATFRAADGVSPIATWAVGDALAQTGSSTAPTGTVDFSLGSVNALVTTLYLGRSPNVSGSRASTGTLTMSAGTFSVANLYDGYQAYSNTDNGAGTFNVNGTGSLAVSGTLYLARTTGNTGATATTGTLNINGASAAINNLVADATGNSTINLNGGTLTISNATGPLTTLSLTPSMGSGTNALLQIAPTVTVGTLTIDGVATTTNIINLVGLPPT
jgi:hypothetical protein